MVATGIWYWRASSSASQIESVAVIPFAYSGSNADTDFLGDGLTQSLIDSLAHLPHLKVKSRNSVFRYKGKDLDVQKVGKELTVDALLTGRVVQRGDKIQVSADLTNVQDNTEIWGEQYERNAPAFALAFQVPHVNFDLAESGLIRIRAGALPIPKAARGWSASGRASGRPRAGQSSRRGAAASGRRNRAGRP